VHPAAAAINAPDTDPLPSYLLFSQAVVRAQLTDWLPRGQRTIVDVSGPLGPGADIAARAGHRVLRVAGSGSGTVSPGSVAPGVVAGLIGDPSRLGFLRDECADAVIAEDRVLSVQLAAEAMVAEIARVLRPGGRVLASVDSLVLGMSVLAGQHHWAHLVDLPHAEVVLVPWPDGAITRCYGPDQAQELFSGAGLAVRSIRPRTMLCESTVAHVLRHAPRSLPRLVRAEMAAQSDDSFGTQLLISAVKRR
jgi:SAM-dependent methyltransferase